MRGPSHDMSTGEEAKRKIQQRYDKEPVQAAGQAMSEFDNGFYLRRLRHHLAIT